MVPSYYVSVAGRRYKGDCHSVHGQVNGAVEASGDHKSVLLLLLQFFPIVLLCTDCQGVHLATK